MVRWIGAIGLIGSVFSPAHGALQALQTTSTVQESPGTIGGTHSAGESTDASTGTSFDEHTTGDRSALGSTDDLPSSSTSDESTKAPSVQIPFVSEHGAADPLQPPVQELGPVVATDATPRQVRETKLEAPATVRFAERDIFELGVPRSGFSPQRRARESSDALARAFAANPQAEVRVEEQNGLAVVLVGTAPVVQLTAADVEYAGDSTLSVHAAAVAAKIRTALELERRRANIAQNVFSSAMVVFLALVGVFLLRRVNGWADKAEAWLRSQPEGEPSLRVRDIEVLSPATMRSAGALAIGLGRILAYGAILYAWLIVSFSFFAATRGLTERLTGFIVAPLSELVSRLVSSLPIFVVVVLATSAVFVLVRFIGLFFASLPKQTHAFGWLPGELAAPASVVVRLSVVVAALVFGAPLVTGNADGSLSRLGTIALFVGGLATVPVCAAALAGAFVVFARRLQPGDFIEWRGSVVRVVALGLLQAMLVERSRAEVRLPTVLLLMTSVRIFGRRRPVYLELETTAAAAQSARELLQKLGDRYGAAARVDLVRVVEERWVWRLWLTTDAFELEAGLLEAAQRELSASTAAILRLEITRTLA